MMCGKKLQVLTLLSTLCLHQYVGEFQFEAEEETEDERRIVITRIPSEAM